MRSTAVPVLFLIFNRPENTQRVFDSIKAHQPEYLFIAADGARPDVATDEALCALARNIATQIDWKCEVKTLFRPQNLGCKVAVSDAINWFFDHVEEGIILEDDCLPDSTFFSFCSELLERLRDNQQVMSISGSNLLGKSGDEQSPSYFRAHGGIWGWATWKRAWKRYDISMKTWPEKATQTQIRQAIGSQEWFNNYYQMFEAAHNNTLDTWDIQWFYSILINEGIAINASVNLVKNIGFESGTHMNSADNPIAVLPAFSMLFPLKHPTEFLLDVAYLENLYLALNPPAKRGYSLFRRLINLWRNKR